MRLLLVNYEFPPLGGGAGNAAFHLGRQWVRLGCAVSVLTSGFRGLPRREVVEGMSVYRVPVARRRRDRCTPAEMLTFILSGLAHVGAVARAERPEVSLAFLTLPSGPVAWWLGWTKHIPFLTLLRGGDVPGFSPEELGRYHRLTRPLIHFLWRQSAAVVANSEGLRQLAEAGRPGVPLAVIPNGVDTEQFTPRGTRDGEEGRGEKGKEGTEGEREDSEAGGSGKTPGRDQAGSLIPHPSSLIPRRALFVGRLTPQKDLPTLLQALCWVAAPVELEIVGDGPERGRLADLAAALGLADRVHFAGWVDRSALLGYYHRADVFVLPSRYEGMPNVILEAMACGLPILATRTAGSEELVEPGRNGRLFAVGDADGLAAALEEALDPDGPGAAWGHASRDLALGRSWRTVARQYLALIEALCL